jgi:polysaccharide export outer membrane protein
MAAKQIVRLGLVAAFVVGCVISGAAQQSNPKITPRDQVTIEVYGIDQLKCTCKVDGDGMLSFPPLEKPVKAAGLTVRELEAEIGRRLLEEKWLTVNPKVSADLIQTKNKSVIVNGEVRTPGVLNFAGEMSVLEALLQAGWVTDQAGDVAFLVRASARTGAAVPPTGTKDPKAPKDPGVVEVSIRELQGGGVAAANLVLADGDMLVVKKAEQVFITGFVSRPGAYSVTAGMTLKQVITLAGGIAERGSQKKIDIRRGDKKLSNVKYETTTVMPGDTITVKARIF